MAREPDVPRTIRMRAHVPPTPARLPMAPSISTAFDQRVWCRSCFTPDMADERSDGRAGACNGGGQRIFVVDDVPAIRDILSTVLTRRGGFQVTTAEDGAAALEHLRRDFEVEDAGRRVLAVDLIVTDIMMPSMTGLELIDALRKAYAALPRIIVISALDDEAHVAEALHLGAIDYVPKPIDTAAFLHRVRALFGTADEAPFHWVPLPGAPLVMLGNAVAQGRAISEAGIIAQRTTMDGPDVGDIVPIASPIFTEFSIPRHVRGRVVRITKLGSRVVTELVFVGVPDRELHGIRRYSIAR